MSLFLSSTSFADSMSLPERLSSIRGDLLKTEPLATYDIRQLQSRYPTPLLLPSSLLPQSAKYPLKALRQLYKQSLVCKGPWPVSPLVTQPVVFVRAMCFRYTVTSRMVCSCWLYSPRWWQLCIPLFRKSIRKIIKNWIDIFISKSDLQLKQTRYQVVCSV